ncbi:hypothetical protein FMM80_00885 [Schaedlerella arabinosiphila]|uniref:Uncharacterized protein n=1 Tax=Schaedlerella arabinosiphila TaxID=2044587 RepID=A0A9X5C4I0_9FIRM|nr:hypothetical protein [Schaedlerella arabinosiphila]
MCKNAYEKLSEHTKKIMVFCKSKRLDSSLEQLCICQRFCSKKDKYIEFNSKINCKYYIE